MIKNFNSRRLALKIAALLAVSLLIARPAFAQNAGAVTQVTPGATVPANAAAKGIGPAPANSRQNKILKGALSAETRHTLQEAMNSYADDGK